MCFETSNPNILTLVQKLAERNLALRLIRKHRWDSDWTALHVEIHCEGLAVAEAIILDMVPMGYQMFLAPKGITYDEDVQAIERRRSGDPAGLQSSLPYGN